MEKLITKGYYVLLICLACTLVSFSSAQTTDNSTVPSPMSTPPTTTGNVTSMSNSSTMMAMMETTESMSTPSSIPATPVSLETTTIADNGSTSGMSYGNATMLTSTAMATTAPEPSTSGGGPEMTSSSTNASTSSSPTTVSMTTPQTTTPDPTTTMSTTTTTTQSTTTTTLEPTTTTTTMTTTTTKMPKGETAKVVIQDTMFGTIGLPLFLITLAALICIVVAVAIYFFHGKRKSGSHYLNENGGPGGNVRAAPMVLQMEDYGTNFETIDLEDDGKPKADNGGNQGLLSFKVQKAEDDTASNDDVNSITAEPPSWLRVEPSNNDETASNFSTQAQTDDVETKQDVDEPSDENETKPDDKESDKLSLNSLTFDENELLPPPPANDDMVEEKTEM
ncbi:mucin-22-like [Argopecten irradians]|uniref:mucin-22-like n=1 Tax=Argopecten irradians TaxID=31199 RepID=UPI003710D40B